MNRYRSQVGVRVGVPNPIRALPVAALSLSAWTAAGAQPPQPVVPPPASGAGEVRPAMPPVPGTPNPPGLPGIAGVEGPALTLEEAVALAVRNNPRVGEAAARVREARARITQARALRLPQASLDANAFRQGPVIPAFQPGADPVVPPYRWTVGVFLNQILFDWGQRSALQRAAERRTESQEFTLAETQNDVRLVVAVAYYNILRAQQLLEVARERREAAAEQLRVARARFEADIVPRFDVIRSEAELANAEQDVIAAQNEIALAEATFNTALGRDVVTPVALEYKPEPAVTVSFEQARRMALENRPQLAAIREEIEAGQADVRSRRAENKPQIGLSAAYDRRQATGFQAGYTYNAGLVMTFPFLDSGLTRGRVREAQAQVAQDRQLLEQARQQLELDIRQAQLDMIEARKRVETAQQELRAAREALRVAEVRYRSGVGTTVEVTDAQLALARAGQNLANAEFDYQTAVSRIEYATGVPVERFSETR